MPRGGARTGAGRPPDPSSLAESLRIEAGAIRTLPKQRTGPTPPWPLSKASARERTVWTQMWKRPQAIVWEEQSSHRQVAMHVRTSVEAEEPGATAAIRGLLLRQENDLLLSHAALLRAGFRISVNPTPAPTVAASTPAAAKRQVPSSRGRLRALPNVGADS
jgi:hypothetical protein